MKPLVPIFALLFAATCHAEIITVAPSQSVQSALDRARPGDVVRLGAGVHRERVAFKNGGAWKKPIVLEGEAGAILDGSDAQNLNWQAAPDVAPGAFLAKVETPVFTLIAQGKIVTMLREDRVRVGAAPKGTEWEWPKVFKDGIVSKPGNAPSFDGVKALALYFPKSKEVLVRFQGDLDPRTLGITVGPKEPVVKISGADRCVVRNLAIRNAWYGVLVENSLGSVVENCTISPTDFGVWLGEGSDRCTVRWNEISMNPYAGADPKQKGAWDNWTAHKRGGHYDRIGVEIYKSRGGHEVHDNFIHDHWGGIEDRGAPEENQGLRIHHNRIVMISDDGLEPNGAEEDCQWNDNWVERSICGFRIKAPTRGPLYAWGNFFWDNNEDFRNYGEVELQPARVFIYHNTSTSPPAITSNKVFGIGTPNYAYFNNLFWSAYWWKKQGEETLDPNWRGDHNVYVRRGENARWDAGRTLAGELKLDQNSVWATGEPGLADAAKRDFSLTANSPARGKGGDLAQILGITLPGLPNEKSPDAGALQWGEPMPQIPRDRAKVKVAPAGWWPEEK